MSVQKNPTLVDLHIEQARQSVILEGLHSNILDIKDVLRGTDKRTGLVTDVDRLKRSHACFKAVLWFVFTTVIGTAVTAVAALISKQ